MRKSFIWTRRCSPCQIRFLHARRHLKKSNGLRSWTRHGSPCQTRFLHARRHLGKSNVGGIIGLDKARYLHVILAPSHGRDLYLTRRLRTAPTGPRPRRRNLLAPPAGALSTNVGFPVTTRGGSPGTDGFGVYHRRHHRSHPRTEGLRPPWHHQVVDLPTPPPPP